MKKTKSKQSRQERAMQLPKAGYIISPNVDFWVTGGISIVVMILLLIYAIWQGVESNVNTTSIISSALFLHVLINWPHFMGSYSLLYKPTTNIKKYPLATIYVPLSLAIFIIATVLFAGHAEFKGLAVNQDMAYFLWLGAAFYLAWHYTGQAWGMIATFSRLSGLELKQQEKNIIRFGLRFLLVWHVVWGAQDLPENWLGVLYGYLPELLTVVSIVCCVFFVAGLYVWRNIKQRSGRLPDRRILASWVAIYLWYLVLFFMPEAYLFVQFSHALQYLAFPLRVELNRSGHALEKRAQSYPLIFSLKYYLVLVVSGVGIFYLPEYFSLNTQQYTFSLVIASAVSIHHYFVDSCIWRISNPDVRKALFSHLVKEKNSVGK